MFRLILRFVIVFDMVDWCLLSLCVVVVNELSSVVLVNVSRVLGVWCM